MVARSKFSQLSSLQKVRLIAVFLLLALMFYQFVIYPIFQLGDGITFYRPVDVRLGELVKQKAVYQFWELKLQDLTVTLEPLDSRRGYRMTSPGTAHFYAAKVNGIPQEKVSCDYQTQWKNGIWGALQFRPSSVEVKNCRPIR